MHLLDGVCAGPFATEDADAATFYFVPFYARMALEACCRPLAALTPPSRRPSPPPPRRPRAAPTPPPRRPLAAPSPPPRRPHAARASPRTYQARRDNASLHTMLLAELRVGLLASPHFRRSQVRDALYLPTFPRQNVGLFYLRAQKSPKAYSRASRSSIK